jgi:ATP-dependent DNA helicase RecG
MYSKQIAPGYSAEKFLQFLDLAEFTPEGFALRRAALLLFAKDIVKWHPRCEVRIVRVAGKDLRAGHEYNVVEDDTIRGNISVILENTWDRLRPHLARTRFQTNALFRESIIYPEDACREALINAVAHRDYSMEGKLTEVLIFDDRIEFRSPGELLSSIPMAALVGLKGAHQSRNVFIARVLREIGYMREMGEGIPRIFNSVRQFELVDPEISSQQSQFVVTLHHRSVFSPKDIEWLESFSDFELTKDEQRVALLGRDGRLLSTAEIIQTLGIVDTEDFRALYERLNKIGIIYSATPAKHSGARRRNVPRFQIRPPHEAQQYLNELRGALVKIGPFEKASQEMSRRLRSMVSSNSPYYRNPDWALRALGLLSEQNAPLPRLHALWSSHIPQRRCDSIRKRNGTVRNVLHSGGYAFAETEEGETFFLHIYNLENRDDWDGIAVGSRVEFEPGERHIEGKPKTAKRIRPIL